MYTKVYNNLKDLNLYAKFISLLLIMLSIIMVENVYIVFIIIGLSILISAILKNFEALQLSLILVVASMFYYLHPFLLIIVKLILLYVLYLIAKEMTNNKEKMYIVDKLFYKSRNKKSMQLYLDSCYKSKKFDNNMQVYDDIDKHARRKYSNYIVKQALIKTNYDLQDVSYRNKLSFYKFHDKKTSILNMKWGNVDNTFMIASILIFILTILYK